MTTTPIRNEISLGKVDGYGNGRKACLVTLELEIKPIDRPALTIDLEPVPAEAVAVSICGNIWNQGKTDIISGGQNHEEIRKHFRTGRAPRIVELWQRWHLNDMKVGTRAQQACLDSYRDELIESGKPYRYDYYDACEILRANGLYEDRGYKYGSAWLVEPVPAEVVEEIKTLFGIASE